MTGKPIEKVTVKLEQVVKVPQNGDISIAENINLVGNRVGRKPAWETPGKKVWYMGRLRDKSALGW